MTRAAEPAPGQHPGSVDAHDHASAPDCGALPIFDPVEITSVYQPIVDLETREIVGAEALARWPQLTVTPDMAFEYARHAQRIEELDLLCQHAAVEGSLQVPLPEGFKVFVNVEPGSDVENLTRASNRIKMVAEITERALLHNPAELLSSIRAMRRRGCGIALSHVGSVPDTLAMLPFVAPDVIKLDISLVRGWPNRDQARILTAVAGYAERSGATILAEGIETHVHLEQAMALGATLGQGWHFSRPGPLREYPPITRSIGFVAPQSELVDTPFSLLDQSKVRIASKGMMLAISRHIEDQGLGLETPPIVLAAFGDSSRFTPATARRYRALAARCPLVVALGAGIGPFDFPGIRGADLATADTLRGEWTVVVVGTHYAGALIARDLGDGGPDLERRYEFALTHDHERVLSAARSLLGRIKPIARYVHAR